MMTSNATLIGSISGGDQSSAAIYYLVVALTPYPPQNPTLLSSLVRVYVVLNILFCILGLCSVEVYNNKMHVGCKCVTVQAAVVLLLIGLLLGVYKVCMLDVTVLLCKLPLMLLLLRLLLFG